MIHKELSDTRLKEIEFRFLLIQFLCSLSTVNDNTIPYHFILNELYGSDLSNSGFLYKEIHRMDGYCLELNSDGNVIQVRPKTDIFSFDYDLESLFQLYWTRSFIVQTNFTDFLYRYKIRMADRLEYHK